jgi:hypothetical protein
VLASYLASDEYKRGDQAVRAAVAARYRELYPEPSDATQSAPVEMNTAGVAQRGDIGDLRRQVGVTINIPKPYAETYSTADEATFLEFVTRSAITTPTAQRVLDFVISEHTYGGGVIPAEAEDRFRAEFAGGLPRAVIDQLIAFYKSGRSAGGPAYARLTASRSFPRTGDGVLRRSIIRACAVMGAESPPEGASSTGLPGRNAEARATLRASFDRKETG